MDMHTFEKIQTLRDDHERATQAIDVDIPAIYHRYEAARAEAHPLRTLKAVVPPDIFAKLERWQREKERYHDAVDHLMGWIPRPEHHNLKRPDTTMLIGCEVEVAETHSGQVEFVPVDGR